MPQLMPLFPLEVVLLPGLPLPLHIFEPRYRQLIEDVQTTSANPAFGVVAIRRGSETRLGAATPGAAALNAATLDSDTPDIARIGTMAEIIEIEPYEDGRSDLLTIGSRRFRVLELHSDKPYLRARVEWLDEDDGEIAPALLATARALCREYVRALSKLAGREPPEDDFADDPLRLSYQVAAQLRLPNAERQGLLEADTAADRLADGMRLMRRELTLLASTRSVPVSPRVLQVDAQSN